MNTKRVLLACVSADYILGSWILQASPSSADICIFFTTSRAFTLILYKTFALGAFVM